MLAVWRDVLESEPQRPAYRRKSVAEGEVPVLVPGSATGPSQPANTWVLGPEGHKREQAEQSRRRACNRLVRPLAFCLHAKVPAHLCKGHLRCPAADEPTQNIERISLHVRAQERLRVGCAGDIAHQNIADRDVLARMMPDRRA